MAYQAGITRIILPEFDEMMQTPQNNPHHMYSVGEHTLVSMAEVKNDRILRFTMLLHDVGKPACRTTDANGIDHFKGHGEKGAAMAVKIMRRLKMDNDTIRQVRTLIIYHDWRVKPDEKQVRHLINKVGKDLFPLFIRVQDADTMAQSEWKREEKLRRVIGVAQVGEKIISENQCVDLKGLAINGRDLIDAGIPKGPEIGVCLQKALELVLDDPEKNNREFLLGFCTGSSEERSNR